MKRFWGLLLLVPWVLPAQNAAELYRAMLRVTSPPSSRGITIQTIRTSSGRKRRLRYVYATTDSGRHTLLRYLEPARTRGMALLLRDWADEIWLYNPRTRRVRKLASHARRQNFENSDFTYEDLGGNRSWERDYVYQRGPDSTLQGTPVHLLVFKPRRGRKPLYGRIVAYLRASDTYPVRILYFDKDNLPLKQLDFLDIREVDGYPTAFKLVMRNLQTGSETSMEVESITYNVTFKPYEFTEQGLRK